MNEKTRRLWPSALAPIIFIVWTIVQFWPALTGTASLSKVQQLAEWDSLFAAQKSGQSMLMDPSLVYLMVPNYLLKANLIHSGQLPLWNQYSGLGCPLAADPQALAFSPLHLPLIFNPGLVAYNQVLVLEIIILGLSTFALARSLKLGLFASAYAMVALAFCPYERWYLELLGNGFCFVPLVYWLILRLRSQVTPGKVWITGFGCAMMVLSAHPELSFFSIGFASLSLILYVLSDRDDLGSTTTGTTTASMITTTAATSPTTTPSSTTESNSEIYKKRFCHACLGLVAAGAIAFMMAGPMLLPFLEYLCNSDSYKFGSGAPAVVRWQTLIFNLLQPGFGGASPTLGPCALLLIPLAFSGAKNNKTLIGVFAGLIVFGLALTGKMFPLRLILSHPPFSYLVVNYAFPSVILMTALLAAFGLHAALNSTTSPSETGTGAGSAAEAGQAGGESAGGDKSDANTSADDTFGARDAGSGKAIKSPAQIGLVPLCLSLILALAVVAFPVAARALHLTLTSANFDMCLPDYTFNRNDIVRYCVFALIAGAAVLAVKLKPVRKTALFLTAAICLGQSAEIITAAKSLPKRATFKYQEDSIVPALKANTSGGNERFIGTGSHLFRPNSNIVFGLSDLRTHNPLFPKHYLAFVKACGAHLDEFNQEFESPLSPLLALASVGSVLSQNPVISELDLKAGSSISHDSLTIEPESGIKAIFTPVILDRYKPAIFGRLALAAPSQRAAELSYNLALYSASGEVLWFSDARPLLTDLNQSKFVSIPTPVASPGLLFFLGLQIFDNKTKHWLLPSQVPSPDVRHSKRLQNGFFFGQITLSPIAGFSAPDYKLVFESDSRLRIYKARQALPRAYAVHQNLKVPSDEAALAAIQTKSFDPRLSVVIKSEESESPRPEEGQAPAISTLTGTGSGSKNIYKPTPADTIKIYALRANQVIIDADMEQGGTVVLNDIFYPGWQCQVDGKPVTIMRANYLMRAVNVPAGRSRIVFTYCPMTFTAGLILLFSAMLLGLGITIRASRKSLTNKFREKHPPKLSGQ
jgi:hypothetical protein